MPEEDLIMFTGTECTHCHEMEPTVQKVEKELKVKVKRLEVWHDDKNMQVLQTLVPQARAIPVFFNKKSGKAIIGNTTYEALKLWAQGK